MGRGEDWTAEECLLAIWAYTFMDRHRGEVKKNALFEEVSRLTGRSLKAAEFKVQNVAWCDKGRPWGDKPISGASNIQGLLLKLFEERGRDYSYLDGFHEAAAEMTDFGEALPPASGPSPTYITEGGWAELNGFRKTRSSKLRAEARRHYRELEGELTCRVCGVTFDGILPGIGQEIEVMQIHHLKAISEQEVEMTTLDEALAKVVPVCPTCHALIHARTPMLAIDEARVIMECVQGRLQLTGASSL